MPARELTVALSRDDDPYVDRLLTAEVSVVARFAQASNATLLVALHRSDGSVPALGEDADTSALSPHEFAVYKPVAGEAPLWDFPDGTLWRRELAACVVDRALGLDMVPTTVARDDLPYGQGVLQRAVPHDPGRHYFVVRDDPALAPQVRRLVLFDLLLDNADRKAGHVLVEDTDAGPRLRLIDHGVCFHEEPHLRTVAWDLAGDPLTDEDRALGGELLRLLEGDDPAVGALAGLLTAREHDRLVERAFQLSVLRSFPTPQHERQWPWPLV